MKAMILAAGLGTRLHPLTASKPKALVEIHGITLLELLLQKLKKSGIRQIIVNVHHFAEQIIDFLKQNHNFDLDIQISQEPELLDTGGGLKKAAWFFNNEESFLLHNVDVFSDIDLEHFQNMHLQSGALASLAVRTRKSNRYFLSDAQNNLCGWESIAPPSKKIVRPPVGNIKQVSFMGIHIISPGIFSYMPASNKFSIIDLYLDAAAKFNINTIDCQQNKWMDLGTPENIQNALNYFPEFFKNK